MFKNPPQVLTIDVEDYFMVSAFEPSVPKAAWTHYESRVCQNTQKILTLLSEFQMKGTFFILGWIAQQYPELVRQVHAEGHEVACHGFDHRMIYHQTPEEFRQDIRSAKKCLEDTIGAPVLGYRAPSFSVVQSTLWALEIIQEEGFLYDASILPAFHARGGYRPAQRHPHKWGELAEFPMTSLSFLSWSFPFSGGGYFRIFPYSFIKWGIQKTIQQGLPCVVYLHPWELDPEQPRLSAAPWDRFKHYIHLAQTEKKLRRLLQEFSFTTVKERLFSLNLLPESCKETVNF